MAARNKSIITKCSSHTIIWDHKHYVTKTKTGCSTITKYRSPNSWLWNKFGYNFSHQYFFSTCHGNQINNQRVLKNIYHVTWIQRIWTVIKSSTITASSSADRTLASLWFYTASLMGRTLTDWWHRCTVLDWTTSRRGLGNNGNTGTWVCCNWCWWGTTHSYNKKKPLTLYKSSWKYLPKGKKSL